MKSYELGEFNRRARCRRYTATAPRPPSLTVANHTVHTHAHTSRTRLQHVADAGGLSSRAAPHHPENTLFLFAHTWNFIRRTTNILSSLQSFQTQLFDSTPSHHNNALQSGDDTYHNHHLCCVIELGRYQWEQRPTIVVMNSRRSTLIF